MYSNVLSNAKIIKRHNGAGVFLGIMAILSIGIPVVLLVLPWFTFALTDASHSGYLEVSRSSPVMFNAFTLMKHLFHSKTISSHVITYNAGVISSLRGSNLTSYLIQENLFAAAVWYILSALCAVILFFQGIILLIRGKANQPHALVVTAFLAFLCNGMLLLDAWRLGAHLTYAAKQATLTMPAGTSSPIIYFGIWPGYITAGTACGFYFIMLFTWVFGLRKRYYLEDIEFVDVDPEPFEKNTGVERNTLPNSITAVGGHAYAKNVTLEIANIPNGIPQLGIGAFSNCLRLKFVTIPSSVKVIGSNCFFNCGRLRRLNYAGTKEEWRRVRRGSNWLEKAGTTTVLCKDGAIAVNPKH